jgi:hypothetical protein
VPFVSFNARFNLIPGDSLNSKQQALESVIEKLQWWFSRRLGGEFDNRGPSLPHGNQKDHASCGLFAINTIEHNVFGQTLGVANPARERIRWFCLTSETQLLEPVAVSNEQVGLSLLTIHSDTNVLPSRKQATPQEAEQGPLRIQKISKARLAKELQEKAQQDGIKLAKRLERERLEQERLEQERLEQERLEQERLERERLEQERLERERLEQERLERERLERERLEQERLERDRLERDRLERDRLERNRLERDRLERDRLERDRLERDRLERDRLQRDRLQHDRLERERLQHERQERERLHDVEMHDVDMGVTGAVISENRSMALESAEEPTLLREFLLSYTLYD